MPQQTEEPRDLLINALTTFDREPNIEGSLVIFREMHPEATSVRILAGGASPEELVTIQRHCEAMGFTDAHIVGLNYRQDEVARAADVVRERGIVQRFQLIGHDLRQPIPLEEEFDIALLNNVLGHLFVIDPTSGKPKVEDGDLVPDVALQKTMVRNLISRLNPDGIFSIEKGYGAGFIGDKGRLPRIWARNISQTVTALSDGSLGLREIPPSEHRPGRKHNERYWQKTPQTEA